MFFDNKLKLLKITERCPCPLSSITCWWVNADTISVVYRKQVDMRVTWKSHSSSKVVYFDSSNRRYKMKNQLLSKWLSIDILLQKTTKYYCSHGVLSERRPPQNEGKLLAFSSALYLIEIWRVLITLWHNQILLFQLFIFTLP